MKAIENNTNKTELIIKDYLDKETNYAIMLTAQWGAGKTHFLRNVVFENLKGTGYRGIIVSLFGVTNVNDIKDRILISLYPIIDNKYVKGAATVLKTLSKAVDLSNIYSRLSDSSIDGDDKGSNALGKLAFDFVDLKKILICFDDLERAKPGMLSNNEVLGYINSLVEDENIKVILIANEGKIEGELFNKIKEKVIGNTLHFSQDFEEALESILAQMNVTDRFLQAIYSQKQIIKTFMENEDKDEINYRTLKYFLSYFNPVAHYLHSLKQPDLMADIDNLWEGVMKFMVMISIEFKKGNISFKENRRLDDQSASVMRFLGTRDKNPKEYNEHTIETYFPDSKGYYFYHSLYNYITGGDIFLESKFESEIFHQYNIINKEIPEAYKLFNRLGAREFYKLEDSQYTIILRQLRTHLFRGAYLPQDFLTIFYYLTRFGNPLRLSKDKLRDDMLKILKKNKDNFPYSPMLDHYLNVSKDSEGYHYYIPLREKILELNQRTAELQQKKMNTIINDLYFTDLDACYSKFFNKHQSSFREKITLSRISPAKFFFHYKNSNNLDKEKINSLILICYELSTGNHTNEDMNFLTSLLDIIKKQGSVKPPVNVSGALIEKLTGYIEDRIQKIAPFV